MGSRKGRPTKAQQEAKVRLFEKVDEVQEKLKDVDKEELQEAVDTAVEEVRNKSDIASIPPTIDFKALPIKTVQTIFETQLGSMVQNFCEQYGVVVGFDITLAPGVQVVLDAMGVTPSKPPELKWVVVKQEKTQEPEPLNGREN